MRKTAKPFLVPFLLLTLLFTPHFIFADPLEYMNNAEECECDDSEPRDFGRETDIIWDPYGFASYNQDEFRRCMNVNLSHTEGRWLDNRQGYTTLGIFSMVPYLAFRNFIPLVDVREHYFNDGKWGGNFGLGVRYIAAEYDAVFGFNAFYDYRKSCRDQKFNQVGVGLEMLTPCWNLCLNGYFPVQTQTGHSSDYSGSDYKISRKKREALCGGDIEIGTWLSCWEPCDGLDLYGAVGTYFYFPKRHQNVYGGEIKLLANIGCYLTLEAKGGYDQVFHGLGQGTVIVSIPFDFLLFGRRNDPGNDYYQQDGYLWDLAGQPIDRQEIIALGHKKRSRVSKSKSSSSYSHSR